MLHSPNCVADEKTKFDPLGFRDALISGLQGTGNDLDKVSMILKIHHSTVCAHLSIHILSFILDKSVQLKIHNFNSTSAPQNIPLLVNGQVFQNLQC